MFIKYQNSKKIYAHIFEKINSHLVERNFLIFFSALVFISLGLQSSVVFADLRGINTEAVIKNQPGMTLSFVNADIESVANVIAKTTGQTIIVDPRVKGVITLTSNKTLTPPKALDAFATALRSSGFVMVSVNGIYRIVPEVDAKYISNSVSMGKDLQDGDQIITRVFKLNFESATNLLPVLRPLVSKNNSINAYAGNNTIVITDFASNIKRIAQLINSIDVPNSSDVQTIKLQYAIAVDIANTLNKVLDGLGSTAGAIDASLKTYIIADSRSNSILIRGASSERIKQIKQLISKLDIPSANNGNIWVVKLKNAEAIKLAVTLRALVAADSSLSSQPSGLTQFQSVGSNQVSGQANSNQLNNSMSGGNAATSALTSSSQPATGGIIQAEPASNSIIITAPEPLYRNLRQVIEQLDQRRAQVYIESLIVEVSSTNAAELGIQWQGIMGSGNKNVGFGGTNYTNAGGVPGSNIVNLSKNVDGILDPSLAAGNLVPPAPGLNLGLITKFNGQYGMSALITALATTQGTNILSTPNLITLDNEEARIVVGQNVPIVTGQYAQTGTNTSVTPFQTISRQDVGLTLRVRPQISDNGVVKMQIYQEVSSIYNQNFSSGIILNKRNIESNVLVDDGSIIVLGGLIEDSYSDGSSGVPFLQSIPIIGGLFRSDSKSRAKTNLLVFIRPYILRDQDDNENITSNRLELMQKSGQQFNQAPLILPKENLPNTSQFEDPLIKKEQPAVSEGDVLNEEKVNGSESLTPMKLDGN
jgi:general secretion pathway protein D